MAEETNSTLEKIKIETYTDAKYRNKGDETFEAMFNPNKYSFKYAIQQNERQAAGTSPSATSFVKMKPLEIELEFLIDGTGVSGVDMDVQTKTDEFLKAAYEYKGDKHKPRYLRITWGKAFVFDCILKSADIAYTLFKPSGTPLRAKITAQFAEFINDDLRDKKEDRKSPDITHIIKVPDKERIDYLVFKIYEDEQYYIDVARHNGLNNFRKIKTGENLIAKPLV